MKPPNRRSSVLLAFGTLLLMSISHQESEWTAPPREARKKSPIPANKANLENGKGLYSAHCLSCHGSTGVGNGPAAKDLEKHPGDLTSKQIQSQKDGALFWKISTGRAPMTAFKDTLSATERWQIVQYVRSLGIPPIVTLVPEFASPDSVRTALGALFDAYDALSASLVEGDEKASNKLVPGVKSAVEKLRALPVDKLPKEFTLAWEGAVKSSESSLEALEAAESLKARRSAFEATSRNVEGLWRRFGHANKAPLHVFKLANGKLWVQADGKPRSPYPKPSSESAEIHRIAPAQPRKSGHKPPGPTPEIKRGDRQ